MKVNNDVCVFLYLCAANERNNIIETNFDNTFSNASLFFSLFSLQSNYVFPRNSNYSTTALLQHLATLPTIFGSDSIQLTDILRTTTTTLSLTSSADSPTQNYPHIIHDRFHIYGYYSGNEPVHRVNYYDQLLS